VGNSPETLAPAADYEHAWNAINELIRSGHSWSGHERNVIYANNQDGSFSDISGISGLDFPDDSRAFAFADLDNDGRLEIILKNRNAPQLRLLRNALQRIGNSLVFHLRGTKSNRDAIGAAITVEGAGRRQTKYLQAGSGFLSQHTKEVFFGLGEANSVLSVSVRWPNGTVQNFQNVPPNHRVEIVEGSPGFRGQPFSSAAPTFVRPAVSHIRGNVATATAARARVLSPGHCREKVGFALDTRKQINRFLVERFGPISRTITVPSCSRNLFERYSGSCVEC